MSYDMNGDTGLALLTAVFTPFDSQGRLALDRVAGYADHLAAWRCPGVFVGGTAGEGASLTVAERQALLERWCHVADGRMEVQVHVGHTSLEDARALAAHAESLGVSAIASVAPHFYRPEGVAELTDFCARIADAAPRTPFTYYHIPSVTGVHLRASDVLLDARERIPTFAGVKYADGDLVDLQRCLQLADGSLDVFVGVAKLALSALGLGASAAIGSVYNFAAPLYQRMFDHVARGETKAARDCQYLAQRVIETTSRYGGELAGFKAMTAILGVDCGPCRLPLRSPGAAGLAQLRAEVEELGFFEQNGLRDAG